MDNNYSFYKLDEDIKGLELILGNNLINIDPEQLEKIKNLKFQKAELLKLMKEFNEKFSGMGWCSSESSIDPRIMKQAIKISKDKGFLAADDSLVKTYDDNEIQPKLMSLYSIPAFRKRLKFIKNAYQDHLAGRYYSSIPLLLMMIDGAVADIAESNKGFHSEISTVEAWDSIVGHDSSLPLIKRLIHKTRGKTTTEKILIPYRNGILHGRDLGYDSRKVGVKCWFLLYTVADWARAKRDEPQKLKEFEEYVERKRNFDFSDFIKGISEDIKGVNEEVESYENSERELPLLGVDIPFKGESHLYSENTPEREVILFLENWSSKRWDLMAKQSFYNPSNNKVSKVIGEFRSSFSGKLLKDFSLLKIEDIALAITEIKVKCDIEYKDVNYKEREIIFRVIYCDINATNPLPRGFKSGKWKIANNFDLNNLGKSIDYLDDNEL